VFSAPSGSGKQRYHYIYSRRFEFRFSISAASRESRGEEANGKDYYFSTKNSNNTSRTTTFWNGKKFTETISTELKSEVERIWAKGKCNF
jgi:guanylate kinase